MLFTLKNLEDTTGALGAPWEFKFVYSDISEEVRKDKKLRQEWYKNPTTKHCFYSVYLGHVESMRVNKENPPKKALGLAADYDCAISDERLAEVIASMKIKPTYIETSIGGNRRLIWLFEEPFLLDSPEFTAFFLMKAKAWLKLDLLPMLDEPAWDTTSRLLCCGDKWEATGHGPVAVKETQSFFVTLAKEFRSRECHEVVIGLDLVEAELKKRYENFNWPCAFELNSQGPSFWVKDSISTNSAIVKPDGMFTFAGHAEKPFFFWSELLGKEFMAEYEKTTIAKATHDIWFDGNRYHRKIKGSYFSMKKDELLTYFKVDCHLSEKKDKSGSSPIDAALNHVHIENRVKAAAPAIPLPQGLYTYMGERRLNTFSGRAVLPAIGPQQWGPMGKFPFLSYWLDNFYNPGDQLEDFLAWYKYYYEGIINQVLQPGPALFLGGDPGCGKTLLNRSVIGYSVGGFADASQFVLEGSQFNSNLLGAVHWVLDDDTVSASDWQAGKSYMMIKKIVSNDAFEYHCKYEVPSMTPWAARLGVTFNLNAESGKITGPMDDEMSLKICLLKCSTLSERKDGFKFPARGEIIALIMQEMPFFLKWLSDHNPPERIIRLPDRYGYKARQEESLLEVARAANPMGPFKEIILDHVLSWFRENPDAAQYSVSLSELVRRIATTSVDNTIMRSMKVDKLSGYLSKLSSEKFMQCKASSDTGHYSVRIWTFQRPANL